MTDGDAIHYNPINLIILNFTTAEPTATFLILVAVSLVFAPLKSGFLQLLSLFLLALSSFSHYYSINLHSIYLLHHLQG